MPAEPLRDVLREAAGSSPAPPSIDELHGSLVRRRRRRVRLRSTAAAGLAALAVVGVATVATQAAPESAGPAVEPPGVDVPRGWSTLPPSPLGARHSPLAVTVGDEVLFLGGSTEPICPPNALCRGGGPDTERRDGAAYDVRTGTWRTLAEAPAPPARSSAAVVGETVHLLIGEGRHLTYDVSEDRWAELAAVPGEEGHQLHSLAAAGDVLVGYQVNTDRPDQVYEPTSRTWTPLPRDPLAPSFDRQYVWTGSSLVLLAAELVPNPGSKGPSFQRAAVLDLDARTWERLPDATETITGSFGWSWDGERVVSASRQFADGGEVNGYGRSYSSGGALDPATGEWTTLPPGPERRVEQRTAYRFGGVGPSSQRFKASGDALFDTVEQRWLQAPPPPSTVYGYSGQAWVDDVLVVWGGGVPFATEGNREGELADTGGLYRP